MAFQSDDFSAFDHAVLPVLGGHGHGFEDEHVIRSFNYVLDVVHTGLEEASLPSRFQRVSPFLSYQLEDGRGIGLVLES